MTAEPEHPQDAAAVASSATWKFEFEDTVNADPLAKGACLKVLRCYLNFCSKSDPRAFCPTTDIVLKASCSKPAVLRAKATLERLGYMVPLFVTEEGATMYRLVNARKGLIDTHLQIARRVHAEAKRDRKRQERRAHREGSNETIPPENDNLERNDTPAGNETIPNTVEELRRASCSEGSNGSLGDDHDVDHNPYSLRDDDLLIPFAVPDTDEEADAFIGSLGDFPAIIHKQLKKMVLAGELTPLFMTSELFRRRA